MPYTKSDETKIYYETSGDGTPLLLINGWGGSLDSWSPLMVQMLAEEHLVIIMDNRGTGRSDKPDEPYTTVMMAADSYSVLENIDAQAAHIMGFSMGGAIAQTFGLEYPKTTRSLILCGSTIGGKHRIVSSENVRRELELIACPSPEMSERDRTVKLLHLLYPDEYVEERLEALVQEETYNEYPTPDYVLARQSQAVSGFDSYNRLSSIEFPVLVMAGGQDVLVPPENSRLLAERIPSSELVVLKGAGHGFLKQRTVEAVHMILSFLRRVDGVNPQAL